MTTPVQHPKNSLAALAAIGLALIVYPACTSRSPVPADGGPRGALSPSLQAYCRGDDPRVTISNANFPVSKVTLLPYQTNTPYPPPSKPPPPFLGFTFHGRTPDGAAAILLVSYDDDGSLDDQAIPSQVVFSERPNAKVTYANVTYPDSGMAWRHPNLDELSSDKDTFVGWIARPVQYNYAVCLFATARDSTKHAHLDTVFAYTSKIAPVH